MFVSYSGDQDAIIPLTQTRIIANNLARALKLVPFTSYNTWYDKKQVCNSPNMLSFDWSVRELITKLKSIWHFAGCRMVTIVWKIERREERDIAHLCNS